MADVNIGARLSVDTGNTGQSIKEMQDNIRKLSDELKNAKVGSDEYKSASEKLKEAQKQLTDSTKEKTSAFGQLKEQLKGTVPGFDAAASGASSFGKQLLALMANPIVLLIAGIVAGLKFLYDAFISTAAGTKQVQQVLAGLNAVVENVANRIMHFGRAIIEFFKGNWEESAKEANAAFGNIVGDMKDTYNVAVDLKKKRQALNKELKEEELKTLMAKDKLADLKAQLADETISAKKKIELARQVKELQSKLSNDVKKNATENYNLELREIAQKYGAKGDVAKKLADFQIKLLGDVTEEEKKQIKEQIAALGLKSKDQIEFTNAIRESTKTMYTTTKQASDDERAANKAEKTAKRQSDAEDKEAAAKIREERKTALNNLREYENKLLKLKQEEELATLKDAYDKEKKVIQNRIADEKRANEVAFQEKKLTKAQQNELNKQLDIVARQQLDDLRVKHEKEERIKVAEFAKELASIKSATMTADITDVRKKELMALAETYSQKRQAVITNEKFNQDQKNQLIIALTAEEAAMKRALDKKFDDEDKAKKLKGQKDLLKAEYDLKVANKERTYQLELEYYNRTRDLERQELTDKKATALELMAFDEQTAAGRINLSNAETNAKLTNVELVSNATKGLTALIGEQTLVGKALSVATATIDTFVAGIKALKSAPPPFGAIAMAGVIASGLATVARIVSVKVPTAVGSSSGGGVSVSPPAPITPQPQVYATNTRLNQDSINSIGNVAVKSYVLEADVNSNQERIRRINRAARLG